MYVFSDVVKDVSRKSIEFSEYYFKVLFNIINDKIILLNKRNVNIRIESAPFEV